MGTDDRDGRNERARADHAAVAQVLDTFFAAFATGPDLDARVAELRAVLHPRATVVRLCGEPPLVLDVEGFVTPRHELLASGRLSGFREWRTGGEVDVVGDVASWWGPYAKEWFEDGVRVTAFGHKGIHLVRDAGDWLVTSVVWDDDPT
jgi:hypothetical protein